LHLALVMAVRARSGSVDDSGVRSTTAGHRASSTAGRNARRPTHPFYPYMRLCPHPLPYKGRVVICYNPQQQRVRRVPGRPPPRFECTNVVRVLVSAVTPCASLGSMFAARCVDRRFVSSCPYLFQVPWLLRVCSETSPMIIAPCRALRMRCACG
jgi:hypothetical protein